MGVERKSSVHGQTGAIDPYATSDLVTIDLVTIQGICGGFRHLYEPLELSLDVSHVPRISESTRGGTTCRCICIRQPTQESHGQRR
jgi:hypothetical protein